MYQPDQIEILSFKKVPFFDTIFWFKPQVFKKNIWVWVIMIIFFVASVCFESLNNLIIINN